MPFESLLFIVGFCVGLMFSWAITEALTKRFKYQLENLIFNFQETIKLLSKQKGGKK